MTFKVGDEVAIRRALGERKGRRKSAYYHGGGIENVPLGARGVVSRIVNSEQIFLTFKNRNYGLDGNWHVHPDELSTSKEQEEANNEERKRKE